MCIETYFFRIVCFIKVKNFKNIPGPPPPTVQGSESLRAANLLSTDFGPGSIAPFSVIMASPGTYN